MYEDQGRELPVDFPIAEDFRIERCLASERPQYTLVNDNIYKVYQIPDFIPGQQYLTQCFSLCPTEEQNEQLRIIREMPFHVSSTFPFFSNRYILNGVNQDLEPSQLIFDSVHRRPVFSFSGEQAFVISGDSCLEVRVESTLSDGEQMPGSIRNRYMRVRPQISNWSENDYLIVDQIRAGLIKRTYTMNPVEVAPEAGNWVTQFLLETYVNSEFDLENVELKCQYTGDGPMAINYSIYKSNSREQSEVQQATTDANGWLNIDLDLGSLIFKDRLYMDLMLPTQAELTESIHLPEPNTSLLCQIEGVTDPVYEHAGTLYADAEALPSPIELSPINFIAEQASLIIEFYQHNRHPQIGISRYQLWSPLVDYLWNLNIYEENNADFNLNGLVLDINSNIPFPVPGNLELVISGAADVSIPYTVEFGVNQFNLMDSVDPISTNYMIVRFVPDQYPVSEIFSVEPYQVSVQILSAEATAVSEEESENLPVWNYFYMGNNEPRLHPLPSRAFVSELFEPLFYLDTNQTSMQRYNLQNLPEEISILHTSFAEEGYARACISEFEFLTTKLAHLNGYQLVLEVASGIDGYYHSEYQIAHENITQNGFFQAIENCIRINGTSTITLKFIRSVNAPEDGQVIQAGDTFRAFLNHMQVEIDPFAAPHLEGVQRHLRVYAGFSILGDPLPMLGRLEADEAPEVLTDANRLNQTVPGLIIRF